jgi:hypothetical protein
MCVLPVSQGTYNYQLNVCDVVQDGGMLAVLASVSANSCVHAADVCQTNGYSVCQYNIGNDLFVANLGSGDGFSPVWSLISPGQPSRGWLLVSVVCPPCYAFNLAGVQQTFNNGDLCFSKRVFACCWTMPSRSLYLPLLQSWDVRPREPSTSSSSAARFRARTRSVSRSPRT